jgi:hypothetical protein
VGNFSLQRNERSFERAIVCFGFYRVRLDFGGRVSPVKRVCDQEHAGFKPTYFKFQSLRAYPFFDLGLDLLDELLSGIKRPLLVEAAPARMNGARIGFLGRLVSDVNSKPFFLESEGVELKELIQELSNTQKLVV